MWFPNPHQACSGLEHLLPDPADLARRPVSERQRRAYGFRNVRYAKSPDKASRATGMANSTKCQVKSMPLAKITSTSAENTPRIPVQTATAYDERSTGPRSVVGGAAPTGAPGMPVTRLASGSTPSLPAAFRA